MAGVINPCAKCGADASDNYHAKYQPAVLRMCSACMRIEQQNKEMKKILEDERRKRDYEQRDYEQRAYTPTPEKPEAVLRRILSSRGETASGKVVGPFGASGEGIMLRLLLFPFRCF